MGIMNYLVDLHLHLDGALSVANCRKIAKIQGIELPYSDEEIKMMMEASNDCHDLNELLEKFEFPLSLLQTKDAITCAIKNLLEELKEQGIIYVEIRFAPQLLTKKGLSQEEVVKASIDGIQEGAIPCNLILCCMRKDNNYYENLETVRIAHQYLGKGVVAIDLAGAEGIYPTKDFDYVFACAKRLDIPFTIHAGEADGAESVLKAIEYGTKRIGHGVRSTENLEVVDMLIEKNITLEICPTSNICTCISDKVNDMPIKYFLEKGVSITINTDNPTVCHTSLQKELMLIKESFNLSDDNIKTLQINAIKTSFASEELKQALLEKIMGSD